MVPKFLFNPVGVGTHYDIFHRFHLWLFMFNPFGVEIRWAEQKLEEKYLDKIVTDLTP